MKELYIKDIFQELKFRRKRIFVVSFLAASIGLLWTFTLPEIFQVETSLIQEYSSDQLEGGISNLAGLAGVDISSIGNSGDINPEMYPMLVKNTTELLNMLDLEVKTIHNESVLLESYYVEIYNWGWTSKLLQLGLGLLRDEENLMKVSEVGGYLYLDESKRKILEELKESIIISFDNELSMLSVKVKGQDPVVTATLCKWVIEKIKDAVREIKQEQAKEKKQHLVARYDEFSENFQQVQRKLADFTNSNIGLNDKYFQLESQRLNSEYNMLFGIMNTMTQQMEELDLEEKSRSPYFREIEPIIIPNEPSAPKRLLIVVFFGFLSTATVSLYYITRLFLN